ncbi:MAG: hypothetical protein LBK60_12735 [Verrucomicrobiales bacterium]|jgi:hypothetical protein|nr:hypothetical protein [Verrucomicrobiales bacterium]
MKLKDQPNNVWLVVSTDLKPLIVALEQYFASAGLGAGIELAKEQAAKKGGRS